jgi:hypothetical protein
MKVVRGLAAGISISAVLSTGCSGGGAPAPAGAMAPARDALSAARPASAPGSPTIGGCAIFPANNPWNTDISGYPLDAKSAAYLAEMNPNGSTFLHPDFGSTHTYGIPYNVVSIEKAHYAPITFMAYASQSDPGPYPIPSRPAIESGSDKHMLILDRDDCTDYETFATQKTASGWTAASGAVFPLDTNKLRPNGWTSADAAGLPILAGLVRYDEVQSGALDHAIRFTMSRTSRGHIHPATHDAATSSDPDAPPMGLRIRLKASFDTSSYSGNALVILTAMKKYGMMLADNGSDFFFTGETDPRWNDDDLNALKSVPASAFEVVDTGPVITP